MKTNRRTCIKNKNSGETFDQFPIMEIWGITILTHDHKVLYIRPEEHFSGSANLTWVDITNDYEILVIENEKKSDKKTGCCGSSL